jgi:hypothetical protein
MEARVISVKYLDGEEETFDISTSEIDRIVILRGRIIISLCMDPQCRKKSCKVIITGNLLSYEISPCDEKELVASLGLR